MSFKEKLVNFCFGEKCPKCKGGRLDLITIGEQEECSKCGYKKVKQK